MDELLRFLGNNYAVIDRFGLLVITVILSLAGYFIRLFYHKVSRRWLKLCIIAFAICLVVIITGLALFVKSNVKDLQVPSGYALRKINFKSGRNILSGELLVPEEKSKVPAVIFISGSDISSYHTNYSRLANEVVTKVFSDLGYAILYYDKQGVGYSEGDWMECTFQDLADDSYAAVQFLKSINEIDTAKIIVVGHSQGGWIAQLVASQHADIQFLISLAGPTIQVKEQIRDDELTNLACKGLDSVTAKRQVDELMLTLEAKSRDSREGRYYHYSLIKEYQPDAALQAIQQPSLFVFGANDRLVLARKNRDRLKTIFNNNIPRHFTINEIPGVGHSFREMEFCCSGSQKNLIYSESFIRLVKSWVESQTKAAHI